MKDEKQKIEKTVSAMRDHVLAALADKFEEVFSRLDAFEETLDKTLEAIAERDFATDNRHDLFEE